MNDASIKSRGKQQQFACSDVLQSWVGAPGRAVLAPQIKKSDHVFLPTIAARQLLSIITHTSGAAVIRASRWLAPSSGEEFGSPQPGCLLFFCFFFVYSGLPHGLTGVAEGWEAEAHFRQTCQRGIMGAHIALFILLSLEIDTHPPKKCLYMLSAIAESYALLCSSQLVHNF